MHVTRRNVLQHVQCRTCKLLFFTTNGIIVINGFFKIYEIAIVQNLATRYVTMFLLQKNVPNFKVSKMFVFAYCTTAVYYIETFLKQLRNYDTFYI